MCPPKNPAPPPNQDIKNNDPSTCFTCTRLNATTFVIVEEDKYYETPFIYVKFSGSALVLIDTGCGGAAKNADAKLTSLREFIETYPVEDHGNRPLNEDGKLDYVVVCSHCHYDHIGAISQFTDPPKSSIWASSYSPAFLSPENLPEHSLCNYLDIRTPEYTITHFAADLSPITHASQTFPLQILHTPGHTPDELAVYDSEERVLFVGDTLYEYAAIIFPKEGSLLLYSATLARLKALVADWNATSSADRVRIACGHVTRSVDAEEILNEVDAFLLEVLEGKVKVKKEEEDRGEVDCYFDSSGGRLSFRMTRAQLEEFRADEGAMREIKGRVGGDVRS